MATDILTRLNKTRIRITPAEVRILRALPERLRNTVIHTKLWREGNTWVQQQALDGIERPQYKQSIKSIKQP